MIQEKVRSMLSNADLPNGFWAEALATAVHLINRSPNKVLDTKIPEEVWSGKPPLINILESLAVKHTAIFRKNFVISWHLSQRNAFFLAMENLARWDSDYGI